MSRPIPPGSHDDVTRAPGSSTGGVAVSGSHPATPAEEVIHAGKRIGKYLIRRMIGRGGMGAVYEAMDVPLQRKVALKILPHEFSQNEEALKRFIREAQLAARLNHPNVVSVFDVGRKGTIYFIAMELVLGTSGQELMESGKKLDWKEASRAIADVCRALAAAHEAGLMHRDIKPGNLLWSATGEVKLSDFGLAKPTQSTQELSITRRDAFVGTPLYMSPEQCRNDGVDARSDIYSLGATFFTLLTGQAPFNQGSAIQILFAHCSAPIPDVRDTLPDVPGLCTYIVQKAMAKNPNDRYQNAREMRHDLESLLGGQTNAPQAIGSQTPTSQDVAYAAPAAMMLDYQPPVVSGRKWVWIGAGIAAAILISLVMGMFFARSTVITVPIAPAVATASPAVTPAPAQRPSPGNGGGAPSAFEKIFKDNFGPSGGDNRDPLMRQYTRVKRVAGQAALDRNDPAIQDAARAMILWHDFLVESPLPMERKMADDARATADKLVPGIAKVQPRVLPEDKSIPLPPPEHAKPDHAKPDHAAPEHTTPDTRPNADRPDSPDRQPDADRPNTPQRRPGPPRRE